MFSLVLNQPSKVTFLQNMCCWSPANTLLQFLIIDPGILINLYYPDMNQCRLYLAFVFKLSSWVTCIRLAHYNCCISYQWGNGLYKQLQHGVNRFF